MKKIGFIGLIFALILGLVPSLSMAAAKHKWKLVNFNLSEQVWTKISHQLAVMINEATKGEVEVTHYSAGEIPYKSSEYLKLVSKGVIDIAEVLGGFNYGDAPILALPDFPYMVKTEKELETFRKVVFPYIWEDLRGHGVEVLTFGCYGPRQIVLRKPIKTLGDMKGLKIRTSGGLQDEIIKAWGGVPTFVVFAEVFTAVQRGILDGVMSSVGGIQQSKSYEVAPYFFQIDGPVAHAYYCINKSSWEALSDENREAIKKVAEEWSKIWDRRIMHELDDEMLKEMVDKKQIKGITNLSMEEKMRTQERVLPILRDFVKEKMPPKGSEAFNKALKALNLEIK